MRLSMIRTTWLKGPCYRWCLHPKSPSVFRFRTETVSYECAATRPLLQYLRVRKHAACKLLIKSWGKWCPMDCPTELAQTDWSPGCMVMNQRKWRFMGLVVPQKSEARLISMRRLCIKTLRNPSMGSLEKIQLGGGSKASKKGTSLADVTLYDMIRRGWWIRIIQISFKICYLNHNDISQN